MLTVLFVWEGPNTLENLPLGFKRFMIFVFSFFCRWSLTDDLRICEMRFVLKKNVFVQLTEECIQIAFWKQLPNIIRTLKATCQGFQAVSSYHARFRLFFCQDGALSNSWSPSIWYQSQFAETSTYHSKDSDISISQSCQKAHWIFKQLQAASKWTQQGHRMMAMYCWCWTESGGICEVYGRQGTDIHDTMDLH